MNRSRYLTTIAVSLYVLLFLIAFWSVLPWSVTGSTASVPSIMEQQLAGCGLETGATIDSKGSEFQPKGDAGKLTGSWCSCWTGNGNQDLYACALVLGALYN
jgi:hypothetical protein